MSTEDNDPCLCTFCAERRELKKALAAARALCGEAAKAWLDSLSDPWDVDASKAM